MRMIMSVLIALFLAGCATHTHVHARYPTWVAYHKAHPDAQFVIVHTRPARHRHCWKVRRGVWRCVK